MSEMDRAKALKCVRECLDWARATGRTRAAANLVVAHDAIANETRGLFGDVDSDDLPKRVRDLIEWWNGLPDGVVGRRVRKPKVPKGWKTASRDPVVLEHFDDLDRLTESVMDATFCHGKGWFVFDWLFTRNKSGVYHLDALMAGAYSRSGKARDDVAANQSDDGGWF